MRHPAALLSAAICVIPCLSTSAYAQVLGAATAGVITQAQTRVAEVVTRVEHSDGAPAAGVAVFTSLGGRGVSDEFGEARFEITVPHDADTVRVTAAGTYSGVTSVGSKTVAVTRISVGPTADAGDTPDIINAGMLTIVEGAACQPDWAPTFGGGPFFEGPISNMVVFDDGWGPALFAGGSFSVAGGAGVSNIAKWDGEVWSTLGSGTNGVVTSLSVYDDGSGPALFAGGEFSFAGGLQNVGNIAKWDGHAWSALGSGVNGIVTSMRVFDDGESSVLVVGGAFQLSGNQPANNIARWDGSGWSPLGLGTDLPVSSLAVFDDGTGAALYAGGGFSSAGGIPAKRVAKWDGSGWQPLGEGVANGTVFALEVFNDGTGSVLIAGGSFTNAGGMTSNRIAKWDGIAWSPLTAGADATVLSLTSTVTDLGPRLIATGTFTIIDGVEAGMVASWDGAEWSGLAGGLTPDPGTFIRAAALFDDGAGAKLIVGGDFSTTAGKVPAINVAMFDGAQWSAFPASGPRYSRLGSFGEDNVEINALAVFDDGGGPSLYVGGKFDNVGGAPVQNLARWSGDGWSAPPPGTTINSSYIFAMTTGQILGGDALYVANRSGRIAKWDGVSWTTIGQCSGLINSLTIFDDGSGPALCAGGSFHSISGIIAPNIARWDGNAWAPVGQPLDAFDIRAMAAFDDGSGPALFVGGRIDSVASVPANNILKWDGAQWSALGDGVNGAVNALSVFDDGPGAGPRLYVGGDFTAASDQDRAYRIARWDGVEWSTVAGFVDGSVQDLRVFDDGGGPALFVAGSITSFNFIVAPGLMKWDGLEWVALGTNQIVGPVNALQPFDDGTGPALAVGGDFIASPSGDSFLAKYQGCAGVEPPAPSPDLNNDGIVNGTDLLILLNEFGGPGAADLNNDGAVDGTDLLILLNAFGTPG